MQGLFSHLLPILPQTVPGMWHQPPTETSQVNPEGIWLLHQQRTQRIQQEESWPDCHGKERVVSNWKENYRNTTFFVITVHHGHFNRKKVTVIMTQAWSLTSHKGGEKLWEEEWGWWLFPCCEDMGGRFIDSFLTWALFLLFLSGDQLMHTNLTLYTMISPQWLSKLKWLWPSVL